MSYAIRQSFWKKFLAQQSTARTDSGTIDLRRLQQALGMENVGNGLLKLVDEYLVDASSDDQEPILSLLERTLEQHPTHFSTEVLRALAILNGLSITYTWTGPDFYQIEERRDCSRINQLAGEELRRRQIRAPFLWTRLLEPLSLLPLPCGAWLSLTLLRARPESFLLLVLPVAATLGFTILIFGLCEEAGKCERRWLVSKALRAIGSGS